MGKHNDVLCFVVKRVDIRPLAPPLAVNAACKHHAIYSPTKQNKAPMSFCLITS